MAKSKEDVVQEFRVQSIQEAAIRVISRKGMASATMQEIAEEAIPFREMTLMAAS